jgi:RNA polymerase sigma factor (sigma-70 family)
MMNPIDQVTAWLFRVARNRIIDLFRRRQREGRWPAARTAPELDEPASPLDLMAANGASPEKAYVRSVLADQLADALSELPAEQREVFVAHELMGRSFKQLSAETGVSINTLLSRKHYAVLHLRRRLRDIYDELLERGD